MIKIAKKKCKSFGNVEIIKADMRDLSHFREDLNENYKRMLDIIFSINSIRSSNPNDIN